MKEAPAVRADGLCFVCEKERKIPERMQKGVPRESYLADPFCSSTCARAYFGTVLVKIPTGS